MLVTCLECGWIDSGNQVVCVHCGNGFAVTRRHITTIGGLRITSADGRYAWLLPISETVTLGRCDPYKQFAVDVDLSIAGAYECGVGRMHARLFVHDGQIWLEDLHSSNGSRIGSNVIWPEVPMPIQFGSVFQLGHMSLVFDVA